MPRKSLPEQFKKTFRALIAQGWKPKDAMREAWRVYKGTAPGMSRKQQPQKYLNPKQTKCPVCRSLCSPGEKYHPGCKPPRHLKSVNPPNFTRIQLQRYFEAMPGTVRQRINAVEKAFGVYDIKVSGQRGKNMQIVSWKLIEEKKNPIVVYNPEMRPRIKVLKRKKIGKIGKRSPLKGFKINPAGQILPLANVEIRYQRSGGQYRGEWFKHPFRNSVTVLGLNDGSILIKSKRGIKLWGTV